MGLAVLVLVGAAAIAGATGGSLNTLSRVPIRGARLVVIAVVAQLVGIIVMAASGVSGFYSAGLALSALAALAFGVRNRGLAGVPLVTIGLVLNAVVVSVNAAMPVSLAAAARAGVSVRQIAAGQDARHSIAGSGTTWRALGDVIAVPLPLRPEIVSPGDVLIAAGLGEFVLLGMLSPRPRRRRADPSSSADVALPSRNDQGRSSGQEEAQAPGTSKEQGQPRQASELLS